MHPVPVQRSRMRSVFGGGEGEERRREASWVVRFSVSGLRCRVSHSNDYVEKRE